MVRANSIQHRGAKSIAILFFSINISHLIHFLFLLELLW